MPSNATIALTKARYFLNEAKKLQYQNSNREDLPFLANVEAAIVFGRTSTLYLQKEFNAVDGFSDWYCNQKEEMKKDALITFFNEQRVVIIHREPAHITRTYNISVGLDAFVAVAESASLKIIRGQTWYKRHPRILWQDAWRSICEPYKGWQERRDTQKRLAAARKESESRSETRNPTVLITAFFADEKFKHRPALELVGEYLDRVERIVGTAESLFLSRSTTDSPSNTGARR